MTWAGRVSDDEAPGLSSPCSLFEAARAVRYVDGVLLERRERDDLQGQLVGGSEHDWGSCTVVVGAQPVRGGDTPAIPWRQTRKAKPRHRSREVVTDATLMVQELGGHHRADRVAAEVLGPARAASVSVEAGEGVGATRLQYLTQHIVIGHPRSIPRPAAPPARAPPGDQNGAMRDITGTGIWSSGLRYGDPAEGAEAAAELEDLGYSALWVPDIGGNVFDVVERLMAATKTTTIATGILNLWMHSAEETADSHARLTAAHGDRFLIGIGVSHAALIDAREPGRYRKPLAAMASFLDGLDSAPTPLAPSTRVLAALGPKMLELARTRAAGAHPYNVTPEHTAAARAALGPASLVLPEQAVVLTTDSELARKLGRDHLAHYFALPNYTNNLRRLGFGDDDFAAGGSQKLIDALVAWGDENAIESRVRQHRDAGADHVCIQVLSEDGLFPRQAWRELAPALTT